MRLYQCPHCGWIYKRLGTENLNLVPPHKYGAALCPGSEQAARNPESDRRLLWKDLEAMQKEHPQT